MPCPHAKKPHSQWEGKSRHKHTPMGVPESHAATCQPTPPRFLTKVVLRASTCSPNPTHPPPNNRKPRLQTTGSGVVKVSKFHPQSQKNKNPQQTSWRMSFAGAQPPMSVHQGSQNNVEAASQLNHLRRSVCPLGPLTLTSSSLQVFFVPCALSGWEQTVPPSNSIGWAINWTELEIRPLPRAKL